MALERGQLLGHAKSGAARKDRDLRDGIGVLREHGHERVPGLMDGYRMLLLWQQRVRRVTAADEEPVPRGVEVGGTNHAAVSAHGVDRRFVHEVGEVGAGEPGRATRYDVEVHAWRERLAAPVVSPG